jgi:hypothetical protein
MRSYYMAKKMLALGVFLAIGAAAISAQSFLPPGSDLMGTVTAYAREYFEEDGEFDGCTYFPDGMFLNGRYINWRAACDQHDRDYDNGVDKDIADRKFRDAMIRLGAPRAVAEVYYRGVQIFGQSRYDAAQRKKY